MNTKGVMGLFVMLVFTMFFTGCVTGCDPNGAAFIAVTDITGGPATAAVGLPLTLAGAVIPANATDRTIVWTVKDPGPTGAVITGSSLTATATGTAIVTATIANGAALGTPFTRDFPLTVGPFFAAEWIGGDDNWVAEVGEPFALNDWWRVRPDNASDKTITWSVKDAGSTGAVITGNVLTATAMGYAVITGTVANGPAVGTPYTQDMTVKVTGPLVAHGDFVVRNFLGDVELAQYLGNEADVVIPDNLEITVVDDRCFWNGGMTSVVVPEGVTVISFGETYYLASVTLPQSLQIIGYMDSYSLTSMTVLAMTPPSVLPENGMFRRDLNLENLAIYVPSGSVDAYKAAEGWKEYADLIQAIP
jgi:hypothetical protein